ncbi:MAG: N-acetylmuramoyl-L-alanine amidase [Opitutaceae bacterium]|nr:N-acetylmuramoyl-L-alanine amidase [Opitutaceae bacterium]
MLKPPPAATLLIKAARWWAGTSLAAWPGAAPAQPATAGAPTYESVRLYGTDYIDAREFARRFGFSAIKVKPQATLQLRSRWTTIDLAVDSAEIALNGLRIFLGEPVVSCQGGLYLSRLDAEKLLRPILGPSQGRPVLRLKTIVLDPGHGGNDPGNQNHRLKLDEKNLTLDVARRLRLLLRKRGYHVVMTRVGDRRVELEDRARIAARARADLFISIHFNAFIQSNVAGAETYVMSPRFLRSGPQAERDASMAATDYPANKHDHWNIVLGYQMHRQVVRNLRAPDRGLKHFRYAVLRLINCPGVLVEAAFLSNDAEARKVSTPAHRQRIAQAIAAGVRAYDAALNRAPVGS